MTRSTTSLGCLVWALLLGAAVLAQPAVAAAPSRSAFVGTYQTAEWQSGDTNAALAAEQSRDGRTLTLFVDLETPSGETFTGASSYAYVIGPHLSSVRIVGVATGTRCDASGCGPGSLAVDVTLAGEGQVTRSSVVEHGDGLLVSRSTTATRAAVASGTIGGVDLGATDAVIAEGSFVTVVRIP